MPQIKQLGQDELQIAETYERNQKIAVIKMRKIKELK